jgi:hypothetical protein
MNRGLYCLEREKRQRKDNEENGGEKEPDVSHPPPFQ